MTDRHRDAHPRSATATAEDPEKAPITPAAERYLQLGQMSFLTTVDLFKIVQMRLRDELSAADARNEVESHLRTAVS